MDDAEAERAVAEAMRLGYRLVDTAMNYRNETGTGRGVAAQRRAARGGRGHHQAARPPPRVRGDAGVLRGVPRRLGLEYVDLYLIHWPLPRVDKYVDSWRAMIKLREEGLVRSIGVSNFTAEHIDRLERETGVLPSVNQIELHPLLPAGRAARLPRRQGRPDRELEPAGPRRRAARRPGGQRRGPGARRHAGPGGAALAHPARGGADPQVRPTRGGSARISTSSASSCPVDEMAAIAGPRTAAAGRRSRAHEEF